MKLVVPSTETTVAAEQTQTLVELDRRTASVQSVVTQFADPPLFSAVQAVVQSIPNNASTELAWGTVEVDSHDGAVDTGGYTVPIDGVYEVTAHAAMAGTAGKRWIFLRLDGTDVPASAGNATAGSSADVTVSTPRRELLCIAGQRISVMAGQNSGGAVNTYVGTTGCAFTVRWVRPSPPATTS